MNQANKPLMVAQLVKGNLMWGVERYVLNLSLALRPLGVNTTIIADSESPVSETFRREGFPVFIEPFKHYFDFLSAAKIARLAQENKVQLIHCHMGVDLNLGVLAGLFSSIPVLATEHFDKPAHLSRPGILRLVWQQVESIQSLFVKKYIAVSAGVAANLQERERVPTEKISVINPGILNSNRILIPNKENARQRLGLAWDDFVLLSVGRLSEEKGFSDLIAAFNDLSMDKQKIKLLIIGDGPLRPKLQSSIEGLGLQSSITLMGFTESLEDYHAAADLFVQPSRQESFGLAAVEAMMAGLAVAATDTTGSRTTVVQGQTGFIAEEPGIKGLCAVLERALSAKELLSEMGQRGAQRAKDEFSMEKAAARVYAIYLDLLPHPDQSRTG